MCRCCAYGQTGFTGCIGTLRRRGFTDDELVGAGIATRTPTGRVVDVFRDRLVLAIRDTSDRIVAFTARRSPDTGPKYPDTAGRAAAARVWEHLTDTEAGTARVAELPDGLDPARLLEVDPGALHQALTDTRPLTHLAIDVALTGFHLEHVEGRLDAVRHLARHLARLEPLAMGAAAAHLIGRMGDGLDPATVQRELISAHVER